MTSPPILSSRYAPAMGNAGTAATLIYFVPLALVGLALTAYVAWRGGAFAALLTIIPLAVDLWLLFALPFPFGFVAVLLLIPVFSFVHSFMALRKVVDSTMTITDWPALPEQTEAVLGEFASYGFVPVGATEWSLTKPPTQQLILTNPAAATYADVTWHPRTGMVLFTVVSDLPGGGSLTTSRSGLIATQPSELRQVFPGHVAGQLVWFHLSALEFLASRGIEAVPATFERALPRWFDTFEADKQRIVGEGASMAFSAAWRGLVKRMADQGPLWSHADIDDKLRAFANATQTAPRVGAPREPWAPPATDRFGSRDPWHAGPG